MQKNKIIKEDGRYLIFYTFEDDAEEPTCAADSNQQSPSEEDRPDADND